MHLELRKDVLHVRADRALADPQAAHDLACLETAGQHVEHRPLTLGEVVPTPPLLRDRLAATELAQQRPGGR